jgi:hypothetical protein
MSQEVVQCWFVQGPAPQRQFYRSVRVVGAQSRDDAVSVVNLRHLGALQ